MAALLFVLAGLGCGCRAERVEAEPTPAPLPTLQIIEEPTPTVAPTEPSANLLGFVVPDESNYHKIAQHGFLRTAENLGYPAKLYRGGASEAVSLTEQAIAEGCSGLLIWAENASFNAAVETATAAGVKVIVPYYQSAAEIDANLYVDAGDYVPEAVRIFCEAIKEKGYFSGRIVIVCNAENALADSLTKAIRASYPQFKVETLRSAVLATQDAVTAYVLENADVLGVAVLDAAAGLWSEAKQAAEEQLRPTPTPSSRARGASVPAVTPTPSGMLNPLKRDMLIIALDYSKENLQLVRDGDIYGLLARPYFDAAAQAAMLLDRALRGQSVPQDVTLNAPLIRANGLGKYESIVSETEVWFAP